MITPTIKRKLRDAYRRIVPTPQTPDTIEQAAIRVIASLDASDVLDLSRPCKSSELTQLIREITR